MLKVDKCDNALLRECFFELIVDTVDKFACKICRAAGATNTIRCRPGAGYTNFKTHIEGKHKDTWQDTFKLFKEKRFGRTNPNTSGTMDGFMVQLYTKKSMNIFGWIEWMVDSKTVLPFSFVEYPQFRKHIYLPSDFKKVCCSPMQSDGSCH